MLNTDVKRSFSNINTMACQEDLKRINWNDALTPSEENPNLPFKSFLNIADRLIDKHCPKKSQNKTSNKIYTMDNPGVEITAGCLQKPSEEIGHPAKTKGNFLFELAIKLNFPFQ